MKEITTIFRTTAHTGEKGDGQAFVSAMDRFASLRTGRESDAALCTAAELRSAMAEFLTSANPSRLPQYPVSFNQTRGKGGTTVAAY